MNYGNILKRWGEEIQTPRYFLTFPKSGDVFGRPECRTGLRDLLRNRGQTSLRRTTGDIGGDSWG